MTVAFQASSRRATPSGQRRWLPSVALLASRRFQLLGALVLGILAPAALALLLGPVGPGFQAVVNTVLAGASATIVSVLVMRRLGAYPKVRPSALAVVNLVLAFAAISIFCAWLGIDFSRELLAIGLLLVVVWFWFVQDLARQAFPPQFLLVGAADGSDPFSSLKLPIPDLDTAAGATLDFDFVAAQSASETPAGFSGVVTNLRSSLPPGWEEFLARCALMGLPVYDSRDFAESVTGRAAIGALSDNNLSSLVAASGYVPVKRAIDVLAAILIAPFAACVCLLVAIAIKLDDGGPVFFRQARMGYGQRPFMIVKFRTMRNDNESARNLSDEQDSRITRLGRHLRKYRIDELPQIINVMRGEMSWIGPRPEIPSLTQRYEREIPYFVYRHIVRPGITGWAQVNQGDPRSSPHGFDEDSNAEIAAVTMKLHYDFFYVKNFSPWLDLLIAAKTVRIIATGFGSR